MKGLSAVRRVLKKCLDCQRRKAPTGEQFMAKLPDDRITPHEPPFTYVGVDYFGPIEVKQGRSRVKRWGCLFTCLTVRAIHLEVEHSLNTDSMINALRDSLTSEDTRKRFEAPVAQMLPKQIRS